MTQSPDHSMDLRLMTKADIPAGMRLKDLAGWNQTPADWERFLTANPDGCFVTETSGRVVGTATTIIYEGRFAWIGMVLVDSEARGRGIGTRLLERAIEYLDAKRVPTVKLDATPQGEPIYKKLGFVEEYEIERWVLERPASRQKPADACARPELGPILSQDRGIFGADRIELLRSLDRDAPEFTLAVEAGSELAGYALGRRGSRADQLGPWIARDEKTGSQLLDEFLRRSGREKVFVDCLKPNPFASTQLVRGGFRFSRPLKRMFRGPNGYPGRPELVSAVLGPEFG